jgi:hypothetical protein
MAQTRRLVMSVPIRVHRPSAGVRIRRLRRSVVIVVQAEMSANIDVGTRNLRSIDPSLLAAHRF